MPLCYNGLMTGPYRTPRSRHIQYADDDAFSVRRLVRLRTPSLLLGLFLGIVLSFVTSRFEQVLSENIRVAFFIPFVVFMADAVGTQTQSIYIRDLGTGRASFRRYLAKEAAIGILLGALTSALTALIATLWFSSPALTLAVALSMFAAIAVAPVVALVVAEILEMEKTDPAVGAGPIATVLQDTISVLLFGVIASAILLE